MSIDYNDGKKSYDELLKHYALISELSGELYVELHEKSGWYNPVLTDEYLDSLIDRTEPLMFCRVPADSNFIPDALRWNKEYLKARLLHRFQSLYDSLRALLWYIECNILEEKDKPQRSLK